MQKCKFLHIQIIRQYMLTENENRYYLDITLKGFIFSCPQREYFTKKGKSKIM